MSRGATKQEKPPTSDDHFREADKVQREFIQSPNRKELARKEFRTRLKGMRLLKRETRGKGR
jgi:hypothetical protein